MWRAVVNWWDAVELWFTQLGFPFQVLLAVVVLLPACWAVAVVVDRISDRVLGWWVRRVEAKSRTRA